MPAIITEDFRITTMTNFIAGFANDPGETHYKTLYMGVAKNNAWPTDGAGRIETDPGFTVPTPTETDAAIDTLWTEIVALKRLNPDDLIPVVREVTYENGDKWSFIGINPNSVKKSFTSTDSYKSIVRNSEGRVYLCTGEPSTGTCYINASSDSNYTTRTTCEAQLNSVWVPTASNSEPLGLPVNPGDQLTFGNYTWEYLWILNVNEIATFVNDDWQPVSYGLYSEGQPGYVEQDIYGINPADAPKKVSSTNLMIRIFLSGTDTGIPDNDDFRIVFLVDSPRDVNDDICVNNNYASADLSITDTGNLIFIENKLPVMRSSEQQEDIRLILQY